MSFCKGRFSCCKRTLRSAQGQVTVRWKECRESRRDEKAIQVKEDLHHHKVPHLDAAEALLCVCTPILAGLCFGTLFSPLTWAVCAWPWHGLYFTLTVNQPICLFFDSNFAYSPFHLIIQGHQSISFPFGFAKCFSLHFCSLSIPCDPDMRAF